MKHLTYTLMCTLALTATVAQATVAPCTPETPAQALECALKNHPDIIGADTAVPIAAINKDLAGRWQNPDFEAGVGYNREESDQKGVELDLAIMQPIETPKKREARRNKAAADYTSATLSLDQQKEIAAIQTLTILNRLRQITSEKRVFDETIGTFSKVIKAYQNRPALSPEDEISLDLFKSALNTYRLEKNQLQGEENGYKANLKTILNTDVKIEKNLYCFPPKKWPILTDSTITNSTDLQLGQAAIARANAEFLDAKTSSFGGFSVGPYVQTRPGDMGRTDAYGVRFSLPIPVYSNAKAAEAGRLAVRAAEQGYASKKRQLTNTAEALKEQYTLGTEALKTYQISALEKQHKKTEELFQSGRVSNTLLIEAHRQMVDTLRSYHQYELETLQALWQTYTLNRTLIPNLNEVCYAKN